MSENTPDQFEQPVNLGNSGSDTLVGDQFGIDKRDVIANVDKDLLVGDQFGKDYRNSMANASKDALIGDSVGFDALDALANVSADYLIKEPPYSLAGVAGDVLVSRIGDPLTVHAYYFTQSHLSSVHANAQHPLDVRSDEHVHGVFALAGQAVSPTIPLSTTDVGTFSQLISRHTGPRAWPMSNTRMFGMRMLVAISRDNPYVPISEVAAAGVFQLVAFEKKVPSYGTAAQAGDFVQLVALQRIIPSSLPDRDVGQFAEVVAQKIETPPLHRSPTTVPTFVQIAALRRIIPYYWFTHAFASIVASSAPRTYPMSDKDVGAFLQFAAISDVRPFPKSVEFYGTAWQLAALSAPAEFPHSTTTISTLAQIVAFERSTVIHQSLTRVPMFRQLAAVKTPDLPWSESQLHVAQINTLAAGARSPGPHLPRSVQRLASMSVQYAIAKTDMPVHETDRFYASFLRLIATGANVPPPAANLGMFLPQSVKIVAQVADVADPVTVQSAICVSANNMLTAARRNVLPPTDVFDPTIGEHIGSVAELTAVRKIAASPQELGASRFVSSVVAHVAAFDAELSQGVPDPVVEFQVSSLALPVVTQDLTFARLVNVDVAQVALGFVLRDSSLITAPGTSFSELNVASTSMSSAILDTFDHPSTAYSVARVSNLLAAAAVAQGSMDDPMVPKSAVDVQQIFTGVIAEDIALPDPMVPLSTLYVGEIHTAILMREQAFDDPNLPTSTAAVSAIMAAVSTGDPTLPDPSIPVSELDAGEISASPVVGDGTLPDPNIPVSNLLTDHVSLGFTIGDNLPDPFIPASDAAAALTLAHVAVHDPNLRGIQIASEGRIAMTLLLCAIRDTSMLDMPPSPPEARPVVTIRIW